MGLQTVTELFPLVFKFGGSDVLYGWHTVKLLTLAKESRLLQRCAGFCCLWPWLAVSTSVARRNTGGAIRTATVVTMTCRENAVLLEAPPHSAR